MALQQSVLLLIKADKKGQVHYCTYAKL